MAGRKTTGGPRGGRGDRNKLTYSTLVTFDDLMTEALVDKAYYWAVIRKSQDVYETNPLITTEQMVAILRYYVIDYNSPLQAQDKLLQTLGFAPFYRSIEGEKMRKCFTDHLLRYVNIFRTDCPFEVTTTNRYTIEKLEASVTARQSIRHGSKIKYLQGIQVDLTKEEVEELKRLKRDFSVVISSRTGRGSIFLGPARFCNHDCEPNASLESCGNYGMEVVAKRDIPIGEEITVEYSKNYFDEDNDNCLCQTCEDKLDKGFSRHDENGQRIEPAALVEVEELDENGNRKRALRERRLQRDYKERPPTPSPTRRRGRPRAPSLSEVMPALSEQFVREESEASSEEPLIVEKASPPKPLPKKKRRVPRKTVPRSRNPEDRGIHSCFPEVRATWWIDPGSTDEESGAEQEEEVKEEDSVADSLAVSEDATVLDRLRDAEQTLEADSVRDNGEDMGECLLVDFGVIVTSKQSTPTTSVDLGDRMDTSPPSTPRASRGAASIARTNNPFRFGRALSGSPAPRKSNVPVAPMMAPPTTKSNSLKRTAAQMSSGNGMAPKNVQQSDSECDKPIPRAGASRGDPMEVTSDSDDSPIPPNPSVPASTHDYESSTTEADDDDADAVSLGPLDRALMVEAQTRQALTTRPQNRHRELPAEKFYGKGAGIMMPVVATPENSPPKPQFGVSSTLKRRLLTTPQRTELDARAKNKAACANLDAVEEGHEADSESDDTAKETPSRRSKKRRRTTVTQADLEVAEPLQHAEEPAKEEDEEEPKQEQELIQRIPGDYLVTPKLLVNKGDAWVNCNLCMELYVQANAAEQDKTERYCHRCVRHAKLFGVCWPNTTAVDGEQRSQPADWLAVLKNGKWEGLEHETKRTSRRRTLIERAMKKQQEMVGDQKDTDEQVLMDEQGSKPEVDANDRVVPDSEEDDELDEMDVDQPPVQEADVKVPSDNNDVELVDEIIRPQPRVRTIRCPLCKVQRPRKGNKRQWFGKELRYICFVCVEKAEAELMATPLTDRDDEGEPVLPVNGRPREALPTPVLDELLEVTQTHPRSDAEDEGPAPVVDDSDVDRGSEQEDDSDVVEAYERPPPEWMSRQASGVGGKTKIRTCRWTRGKDWPCSCGIFDMVQDEATRDRCNLDVIGMETLMTFSHHGWATNRLAPLLSGVDVEVAREHVAWILETGFLMGSEIIRQKRSLRSLIRECYNRDAAEVRERAQPGVRKLKCNWENQFGCMCHVLNRIREEASEERCDLSFFGIITLKKALHDEIYTTDAVRLMQIEAHEETEQLFASVLRSYCEDEFTYEKCFDGEHPPFDLFRVPDEDEDVRIVVDSAHDDDNDEDDDGDSSDLSTPPDQSPADGTQPTPNSMANTDNDDLRSQSSITFLGETRIDGTPANPQVLASPVRPSRRSRHSSSGLGLPASFTQLGGAARTGRSRDDAIALDDTPPGSQTTTLGTSMPMANMGGQPPASSRSDLSRSSFGVLGERPALLRADGTPKSAREVFSSNKGKGKENERLSHQSTAQGKPQSDNDRLDSDEMLLDHESQFGTPRMGTPRMGTPSKGPSSAPSTGATTPGGSRRIRRNRMGGRGPGYEV